MNNILQTYNAISLDEIQRVKLMKRVDTKFVITKDELLSFLPLLTNFYDVLEINNERNLEYRTQYYDTEDYQMYTLHHNGKRNRHKIRIREYVSSNKLFLEVKFKNNKQQTIKNRIVTQKSELEGCEKETNFIENYTDYKFDEIEKKSANSFYRITLAHKTKIERVTIDTNIKFYSTFKNKIHLNNLSIIEIKQEKFNINSEFMQLLKNNGIRQMRVSKYCTATSLFNSDLKYNRFKRKLLHINKLVS